MKNTKIRSWNKFENHFFYFQNGKYFKDSDCKKCVSERICREFMWSNAEWCTELYDKNGKEIYTGEILYNNDREEHCIVKYSKEKAMFIVKYLENNDEFPLWESISNLYYSVGNIYENPELLEKKFAN